MLAVHFFFLWFKNKIQHNKHSIEYCTKQDYDPCFIGPFCLCKNKAIASQEVSKVEPSLNQTRDLAWMSATSLSQANRPDCIHLWQKNSEKVMHQKILWQEIRPQCSSLLSLLYLKIEQNQILSQAVTVLFVPCLKAEHKERFFSDYTAIAE